MRSLLQSTSRSNLFARPRWSGPAGMKMLLQVSVPLILSHALLSINMFLDRLFLSWYGEEEFAAALQAGALYWTINIPVFSTALYAGTLGAQYIGSGQAKKLGPVVWQSIYFSLFGILYMLGMGLLADPFFTWIGHEGNLPALETEYFWIFCLGAFAPFFAGAMQGYFSAQNRTSTILFVSFAQTILNVCLNTWLIFEPIWIFPDGIGGAAWATVISNFVGCGLFILMAWVKAESERDYQLFSGWRFDPILFRKLIRYGLPAGSRDLIDMIGFSVFLMAAGTFGLIAQYASNITMNLNMLFFIPAIGLHAGLSIVFGQRCGANDIEGAEAATNSGLALISTYLLAVCAIYVFIPGPLLNLFRGSMSVVQWEETYALARLVLWFVVAYTLADILALVYSGALKGSGDTTFVLYLGIISTIFCMVLPTGLILYYQDLIPNVTVGLALIWGTLTLFLCAIGFSCLWRYWHGYWKSIRMVDQVQSIDNPLGGDEALDGGTAAQGALPL